MADAAATVDEYIATFPPEVQERLEAVRGALHEAVPGMTEGIRYAIPFVAVDGLWLVHFAGWKHHIGMYPIPVLDGPMEEELTPLRSTKDTIKLVHAKPLPLDLVRRLAVVLAERRTPDAH